MKLNNALQLKRKYTNLNCPGCTTNSKLDNLKQADLSLSIKSHKQGFEKKFVAI